MRYLKKRQSSSDEKRKIAGMLPNKTTHKTIKTSDRTKGPSVHSQFYPRMKSNKLKVYFDINVYFYSLNAVSKFF